MDSNDYNLLFWLTIYWLHYVANNSTVFCLKVASFFLTLRCISKKKIFTILVIIICYFLATISIARYCYNRDEQRGWSYSIDLGNSFLFCSAEPVCDTYKYDNINGFMYNDYIGFILSHDIRIQTERMTITAVEYTDDYIIFKGKDYLPDEYTIKPEELQKRYWIISKVDNAVQGPFNIEQFQNNCSAKGITPIFLDKVGNFSCFELN